MAAEYLVRMGERLRERRDEMGLSRSELARMLPGKVSENQIYRWEIGKHQPNPDTLEALAQQLERPVAYFMAPAPDKSKTPDLSVARNGHTQPAPDLAAMQEQLDRIEQNLGQLVALLSGDEQAHGDLGAQILKTVERGLTRQAREAMRIPPRHSRGLPPESPQAAAEA